METFFSISLNVRLFGGNVQMVVHKVIYRRTDDFANAHFIAVCHHTQYIPEAITY